MPRAAPRTLWELLKWVDGALCNQHCVINLFDLVGSTPLAAEPIKAFYCPSLSPIPVAFLILEAKELIPPSLLFLQLVKHLSDIQSAKLFSWWAAAIRLKS